jgi:Mn-dependent DtxR family transcriptional regulator
MHRRKPLTETQEMYLKTLYQVGSDHEVARVSELADGLGVSPGTVTGVLKKLHDLHLVEHERYGLVSLTPTGNRVAECVVRRFETLRDLLVELLGIDPDTAAVDACMMEHAVSPLTVNRMRALLERVRAGRVTGLAQRSRRRDTGACSRCEVLGACQAESLSTKS